jgi:hypothetical protein
MAGVRPSSSTSASWSARTTHKQKGQRGAIFAGPLFSERDLVTEMPDTGEDHRQPELVRRSDHIFVAH